MYRTTSLAVTRCVTKVHFIHIIFLVLLLGGNKMTDDSKILLSFNLLENVTEKEYFKYLYCLSNNYINNYKIIKVKKKNGKMRTIYVPAYALKKVQRKILHNVLEKYELSVYAKAYRKGISLIDNAKGHLNKKVILKLDIYKFFDNISFEEV